MLFFVLAEEKERGRAPWSMGIRERYSNENRGGGGVHPKFFGKVILEIVIDQKPPPIGRTFGGVLGPPCPTGRAGRPRSYTCTKFRILKNRSKPSLQVLYL